MYQVLDLLSDQSERVHYNLPEMPVYARRGKLSHFQNLSASSHWHDDVEFVAVLAGRMSYNVNGKIVTLNEGDGILVNSRQLHYGFSTDGSDCDFVCVLLHPILLCANSFLERQYIAPIVSSVGFEYHLLRRQIPWEAEVLHSILRIHRLLSEQPETSALLTQSLFFQIWSLLYERLPKDAQTAAHAGSRLPALREMIGFIQKHYDEQISLAEIASAGKVCISGCCAIFHEYLSKTPVQYLTGYRLNKSVELLRGSSMSILEVALAVGFNGASYYAETFRKYFNCSPTDYRRNIET